MIINDLEFFKKNGFIVIKNGASSKNINEIFRSLEDTLLKSKYKNKYKSLKKKNIKFNISETIKYIKKVEPSYMSKLYDNFQNFYVLKSFLEKKFFKILEKKIKINRLQLVHQQQVLRMDVPKKNVNLLDYHQDYMVDIDQIDKGHKIKDTLGITIWCPLFKADKHHGGLEVLPRSHKYGWVGTQKPGKNYESASFSISKWNKIKKLRKNAFITNMNSGDILIMDTRTIHRSIDNHSNICRFTAQYRYGINSYLNFLR
jgi:ectoine hydroxylase-related dioxygenase (phytanoyl-CoA dioxygenase family)